MVKISDSELEIMHIIWENERITSLEIIKELSDKKLDPNTIRTFIKRLYNKKAITIIEKRGNTYIYGAIIDKNKYCYQRTIDFLKRYYNSSLKDYLVNLVKYDRKYLNDIKNFIKNVTND